MEIKMPNNNKTEVSEGEKKLMLIVRWVWRNLLASGVFLSVGYFLWGQIDEIKENQQKMNDSIIKLHSTDTELKGVMLFHLADVQNKFGEFEERTVSIVTDSGETFYETRIVETEGKIKAREVVNNFIESNSNELPPFQEQDNE